MITGRTGGLLLDTGAGPTFLPLPAGVMERIAGDDADEPGVTTIRAPPSQSSGANDAHSRDYPAREIDLELCFVCKKCRVAFPGESPLLIHQRQCFSGKQDARGAFRIVQIGYECKLCVGERFKTLLDLRKHCETSDQHLKIITGALPTENPLSHEMEDVVNQITLLAARAAQESSPAVDSNSNAFAAPPEPKRRFLPPPPEALKLT